MARQVTCRICKAKLMNDIAYKVSIGNKNMYYCSEAEYIKYQQEIEDSKRLNIKLDELFGQGISFSYLLKELKPLINQYSHSLILDYVEDNFMELDIFLSKDFNSGISKIKYFIAILKNNLYKYKKQKLEVIRSGREIEYNENFKFKPRSKRKTISEYLEEY